MNVQRAKTASVRAVLSMVVLCVLCTFAVLLPAGPASALPAPPPRVIVVGAGIAGLAAAQSLTAAGFDVLVLEARGRVGGRMYTDTNASGTTLDLGANWIHGDQAEFKAVVASMDLVQTNTDFTAMRVYSSRNHGVDINEQIRDDLKRRLANALVFNAVFFPDTSVQSMLDHMWSTGSFLGYTHEFIDTFTTAAFDTEFAASASKIPVRAVWELSPNRDIIEVRDALLAPGGEENTALPQGFNQVTDRLRAGLDIRLNTAVTCIDYSANPGAVAVTANDGSELQFAADHVIVTVPIGVLKAQAITFIPPLPSEKLGAIQRLGNGLLNKVFLEWPEQDQFWPSGPDAPDVFGTSSPHRPNRGAFSIWINMQKITGKPILMAWTSGDSARTIENWDDEKTKREALRRLRDTFPRSVPDPSNIKVTRWSQDPFARGSYSTFALTTQLGDRGLLGEPVRNNKVLFAGEATIDFIYAQVTGGYFSGLREADRLIQLYASPNAR